MRHLEERMADSDVALYGHSHGGVDRTSNIYLFASIFTFPTCHGHLSSGEYVGDGVGEDDEGGDGGPEEGQGEDHQGGHQVHKVIHAQGHHQAEILLSMSVASLKGI